MRTIEEINAKEKEIIVKNFAEIDRFAALPFFDKLALGTDYLKNHMLLNWLDFEAWKRGETGDN